MASKKTGKPTAKSAKPPKAAGAKPTAKAAKPAAKAPSKALTRTVVKKPATAKISRPSRSERPARHEKPGTGREVRGPSIERMRPLPSGGDAPERRIAEPVSRPSNGLSCPFGKQELAEWRRILLDHRSEISQDISHLEQGAMEAEDGHTTPNHLAERGSDAEMQDMSLGLAGEEQVVLWQIDRALRKIDSGSPAPFGLCEHTKQPIPKTRLQLIPWTPVTIEGMNYVEENGLTLEDVLIDG